MKVILKESLENLGTVGDTVSVKDGYARNYLLPQGLAILADPKNLKAVEHHRRALEKARLREIGKAEELAAALSGTRLVFQRRASDQSQLFGSVTNADIETRLQDKGFKITRKQLVLAQAIKALGEFEVTVKLGGGVSTSIQVVVEREAEA
jgi:large subunit ribosomal protein L9